MAGAQSALIVTVPAAEEAVAPHRARFDRSAGWGVPAHVTVLYPFAAPADIDAEVLSALAAAIASVSSFGATFETTGWFTTSVLWLAPEPTAPFAALTTAVTRAFPGLEPYGGAYETVVPHLTVGHDVAEVQLRGAEADVLPHLPIRTTVEVVELWSGTDAPGGWRRVTAFPLA